MAKIKLGQRPKAYAPVDVTFAMPDGTTGAIDCTFKYRTRTEFGELVDSLFKAAGAARPAGDEFSMKALMESTRDQNAGYLLQVLDAWDLDVELGLESLAQLADELPAAAAAIMERYRSVVVEGRLGN